jgi:Holliday junction DNA helicase, RuvA subunit
MISFLRGILVQSTQESLILETGGLGYEVQIHSRAQSALPHPGSELLMHTYLQVLDNDLKLYGFLNRDELELFKTLLGVSGMGARGALNVLAALNPADFYQAVALADEKRLLAVPGIGKKTAQRLVFELKDKVGNKAVAVLPTGEDRSSLEEVLEALEALGYQRSEIFPVIMEMKSQGELGDKVEDNIKRVLRRKAMQMKK